MGRAVKANRYDLIYILIRPPGKCIEGDKVDLVKWLYEEDYPLPADVMEYHLRINK